MKSRLPVNRKNGGKPVEKGQDEDGKEMERKRVSSPLVLFRLNAQVEYTRLVKGVVPIQTKGGGGTQDNMPSGATFFIFPFQFLSFSVPSSARTPDVRPTTHKQQHRAMKNHFDEAPLLS
jgi:hypothetical protein